MISSFASTYTATSTPAVVPDETSLSAPGVAVGFPGSAWRPQMILPAPTGVIEKDPQALRLRWWRARPNPSYSIMSGRAAEWDDEFIREEMTGEFWGIIEKEGAVRRYFKDANVESGDIALVFNPSTFCTRDVLGNVSGLPSEWDHVMELGGIGSAPSGGLAGCGTTWQPGAGSEDRRTFTQKSAIARGGYRQAITGRMTSVGANVTGAGTAFLTELNVGDIIYGMNSSVARVLSITDDTAMTLDRALTPNLSSFEGRRGKDRLPHFPVVRIQSLRSVTTSYAPGVDFTFDSEEGTIIWLSATNSPQPGETIGVIWDYVPRWSILDFGVKGITVRGIPSLTVVQARLWKPESLRTGG